MWRKETNGKYRQGKAHENSRHLAGVPGKEEAIIEQKMAENFLELMKYTNPQIQVLPKS